MGTVTVTGASAAGARRDCGSFTGKPGCIIGAATMKMTSKTSMTSTSGTTLISASDVETRTPRARRPPPRDDPPELVSSFGISGEVPLGDRQELHGEVVHLVRGLLHAARDVVVEVHGRNRGEEARRRGDERLGDARRD